MSRETRIQKRDRRLEQRGGESEECLGGLSRETRIQQANKSRETGNQMRTGG